MRKITPVLEGELPELLDGWSWSRYVDGTWMTFRYDTDVYVGALGVYVNCDAEPVPVPFEVIAAVMKANGVEL